MKKQKIWIYEYKDDDTPTGATFLEKFVEDIDSISLPHLQESWHWRIDFSWEEKEGEEDKEEK